MQKKIYTKVQKNNLYDKWEENQMKNEKEILENFDKIIGANNAKKMDISKFPLLLKIFEQYRDDIFVKSQEYKELEQNRKNIEDKINLSFSNEQKQLFENYWDIEKQMQSEVEKAIFLFGYLLRAEIANEKYK